MTKHRIQIEALAENWVHDKLTHYVMDRHTALDETIKLAYTAGYYQALSDVADELPRPLW